jgi:hypothetical protein
MTVPTPVIAVLGALAGGSVGAVLGFIIPFGMASMDADRSTGGAYMVLAILTTPAGFILGVILGAIYAGRWGAKRKAAS